MANHGKARGGETGCALKETVDKKRQWVNVFVEWINIHVGNASKETQQHKT